MRTVASIWTDCRVCGTWLWGTVVKSSLGLRWSRWRNLPTARDTLAVRTFGLSNWPRSLPRWLTHRLRAFSSPLVAGKQVRPASSWHGPTGRLGDFPRRPRSSPASGATTGSRLRRWSATGISGYWPLFEPRVPGFIHIPSPYPYRYEAPPGVSPGVAAADELERVILQEGPETIAMFIAEPIQGAGGRTRSAGGLLPPNQRNLRPVRCLVRC